jgi:ATP adenylyltransferase/5',5'''-P-1,P-4-tetraphosphate phosphorylase II
MNVGVNTACLTSRHTGATNTRCRIAWRRAQNFGWRKSGRKKAHSVRPIDEAMAIPRHTIFHPFLTSLLRKSGILRSKSKHPSSFQPEVPSVQDLFNSKTLCQTIRQFNKFYLLDAHNLSPPDDSADPGLVNR